MTIKEIDDLEGHPLDFAQCADVIYQTTLKTLFGHLVNFLKNQAKGCKAIIYEEQNQVAGFLLYKKEGTTVEIKEVHFETKNKMAFFRAYRQAIQGATTVIFKSTNPAVIALGKSLGYVPKGDFFVLEKKNG